MITFWFFRHAESEANANPHLIGGRNYDADITQIGCSQSLALGTALNGEPEFDKIWCSPQVRTTSTMHHTLLNQKKNSVEDVIFDERLVELSQGDWEGELRDEVYSKHMLDLIIHDTLNFKAPNGESQLDVANRVTDWMNEAVSISVQNGDKNVAVFGHGLATKCLLCKYFGISNLRAHSIMLDNCSLTKVLITPEDQKLLCLNYVYPEVANVKRN